MVEVLGSSGFTTAAQKSDLDAWVSTYELPVTTVIDAPGAGTATLMAMGRRENTVIVQLPSMQVVWRDEGDFTGSQTTGAVKAIDEALVLLAQ